MRDGEARIISSFSLVVNEVHKHTEWWEWNVVLLFNLRAMKHPLLLQVIWQLFHYWSHSQVLDIPVPAETHLALQHTILGGDLLTRAGFSIGYLIFGTFSNLANSAFSMASGVPEHFKPVPDCSDSTLRISDVGCFHPPGLFNDSLSSYLISRAVSSATGKPMLSTALQNDAFHAQ